MAKKRTRKQKIAAKHRVSGEALQYLEEPASQGSKLAKPTQQTQPTKPPVVPTKKEPTIADVAFTGEKVYLIKGDLLKTIVLTAAMFILLIGIYRFIR